MGLGKIENVRTVRGSRSRKGKSKNEVRPAESRNQRRWGGGGAAPPPQNAVQAGIAPVSQEYKLTVRTIFQIQYFMELSFFIPWNTLLNSLV